MADIRTACAAATFRSLARIVHVADAYDAITSARAYRAGAIDRDDALRELWRCAGTELRRRNRRRAGGGAAGRDVERRTRASAGGPECIGQSGAKALRHATLLLAILLAPASTFAQPRARVSLDSVTAIDFFKGRGDTERPDASVDIGLSIRVERWMAGVRAAVVLPVGAGSDSGQGDLPGGIAVPSTPAVWRRAWIWATSASPIGLGMLDMRADINPTIRPHLSYFVPLMPFDRGTPSVSPIASSYPLGAQLSASTARWDARAALVNSTPTRKFALNADTPNPRATPAVIAGGGFTPRAGLRIGTGRGHGTLRHRPGSEQRGRWRSQADDVVDRGGIRWSAIPRSPRNGRASGSPPVPHAMPPRRGSCRARRPCRLGGSSLRVMKAHRRRHSAARRRCAGPRLTFKTVEAAVGFRVSPELTVRGSLFAQQVLHAR